jgi:hypothetical protein
VAEPSKSAAQERREHSATVVGVVVAGVLASVVVPGPYSFGSTLIGLTLLCVLFGYGEPPRETAWKEAIGYCGALAFALLLTLGFLSEAAGASFSSWTGPQEGIADYEKLTQTWKDGLPALSAWAGFFAICYGAFLVRWWTYARSRNTVEAELTAQDVQTLYEAGALGPVNLEKGRLRLGQHELFLSPSAARDAVGAGIQVRTSVDAVLEDEGARVEVRRRLRALARRGRHRRRKPRS